MDVDLVLRGASGLGTLCYFVGMLYFGFMMMRAGGSRPEMVFFWAVVGQVLGLVLMAVMSVVMKLFGYGMMSWGGGWGVDWIGMLSSILDGAVLLCGLVGAVALLMVARRAGRR